MRRSIRDARRRALAQNFLVDAAAVAALAHSLPLDPDETVLDLGAGTGALTAALRNRVRRVVAVELDPAWAAALRRRAAAWPGVEVVEGDVLRVPLPAEPFSVVASPPWNIGTAVVRRLLGEGHGMRQAALLLQREAARRLGGGGRVTSVWAPWFELGVARTVPRQAFRPVPAADAAVLVIRPRTPPLLSPAAFPHHVRVVDAVFAGPGPTVATRLRATLGRRGAIRALAEAGIPPDATARGLDAGAWARLTRAVTTLPP